MVDDKSPYHSTGYFRSRMNSSSSVWERRVYQGMQGNKNPSPDSSRALRSGTSMASKFLAHPTYEESHRHSQVNSQRRRDRRGFVMAT